MKKGCFVSIWAAILLVAGCTPQPPDPDEEVVRTVNVETQEVEPRLFERFLKLVGTVEAPNDVQISAEVSGRILNYHVEQGDRVEQGEPILKIDDAQLVREMERLEAATAQSRENYERLKRLYEEQGVGSEIEYLNARYTFEQNQASLEAVRENIAQTSVTAPFDGRLENIMLEEGEMASPGAPLIRLIGTNRLQISTGVPANYSDVVSQGDTAFVWFDFQMADTLKLPIRFVGQSIEPNARTFEVEIPLPPESGDYKVDMNANVRIKTLQEEDVIVVGAEYIYQEGGQNQVYTVAQNSEGQPVARVNPVRLGPSYRNEVIIMEGLNAGDRLITVGSAFLQDSMRINIIDEEGGVADENLETRQ